MLKTLTFTMMHFAIAFSVAWAVTGSLTVGGLLAVVEPLCNALGFFVHERFWKNIEHSKTVAA